MLESKTKPSFALPELPYEENALKPVISARTLSLHHGKHHVSYVKKLNQLVEGSIYAGRPLDEVVKRSAEDPAAKMVFNNAAQAWNHDFYWRSMRPRGGGMPSGALRDAIGRDFGGLPEFRTAFTRTAVGVFGSGWAWLVTGKGGALKVVATDDADTPIARGETPLLTLDVWEHAYYLDYQDRRLDHIAAWLENLINWEFAEMNFSVV